MNLASGHRVSSRYLERINYFLLPYQEFDYTILTFGRDESIGHFYLFETLKKIKIKKVR